MALILYQRDDCHLCDLALDVLANAGTGEFASVFVDGDATLERRYGERVPVLADGARELDWPFDAARLRRWLADDGDVGHAPADAPATSP
ncbi:glutaredoxin family protein [Stenotrophomonas sp. MMGLT7]|uniref:glutaredoxin family protein n=1 Tax=Stenotrophomonas sp. MMGLT7 TaxID=2901227 RepID=UPI001E3A3358|nr:glutaredoxin family protein [Stenotrophomonas sp. MMGLT7]MCD7100041.1 glutaredoxin family protein [Stenotrophomonas sp. MMGLT7]